MRCIYILMGVFTLVAFAASAQGNAHKGDSLNHYQFPDYYAMDTTLKSQYPFIHFEKNHYEFFTSESPNWEHLYKNMQKMIHDKDRKLNFYHLGGSHLQADIYTHVIRTKLQTTWPDVPGERGFLFPFDLAKTNNPGNYEFSSPNTWKSYRSVGKERCSLGYGLLGFIVTCPDSVVKVRFRYDKTEVKPSFSKIRILHNKGQFPYDLNFGEDEILILDKRTNLEIGYTDVYFTESIDTFDLQFSRTIAGHYELQLAGVQLINTDPGISYTAIGVNGAALYTYLNCSNFEEQLKQSPPDFFAFSVGTNDANVPYEHFKPEVYKSNLEKMIKIVLRTNPKCAILLTVPNDSHYHKVSLNRNIARQRQVINELAIQYQIPVWDLYGVMGELGSSKIWLREKLMRDDMVHFTNLGYHIKGDLYFDAFMKWMQQMDELEQLKK